MITQELLNFIRQNILQGKSNENIKAILLNSNQGWKDSDIDEAFNVIQTSTQTTNLNIQQAQEPASNKIKGIKSLIGTEIIFLILIIIGFMIWNEYLFKDSSFGYVIAVLSIIILLPSIIVSIIGVKDGIKGIKNKIKGGTFVLVFSVILLLISMIYIFFIARFFAFLLFINSLFHLFFG